MIFTLIIDYGVVCPPSHTKKQTWAMQKQEFHHVEHADHTKHMSAELSTLGFATKNAVLQLTDASIIPGDVYY